MYKVLLVDDEPFITKGLQALLDWEDYHFEVVSIAENGAEALAYLKENTIDLLITDIMMPKMSGLELIKEAKKVQPDLKSIVLSGYQEFDFVKQGITLGIENYLLKPVDEEELIKTIQTIGQKLHTSLPEDHLQDVTTLKDNTLWRLINGEIEKGEWQERLSLYNIDFSQSFYNVSILHFENEQDMALNERVRKDIEANYPATCFYNPDQELLIIFESDDKERLLEDNHKLVDQYLSKMNEEIGTFFLAMGEEITTVESLQRSYHSARELTYCQIELAPDQLITNTLHVNKHDLFKGQQDAKTQLSRGILNDKAEVKAAIQLYINSINYKTSFVSHRVIRKYTTELISYIHHSVQMDEYNNYATSMERIFYATTNEEIIMILQHYCEALFGEIHNKEDTRSPIIQNVLEYIYSNYDQELSLKTLSQRFYINPIYLGQLFQKELDMVFSDYVNQYRIEKSKKLLRSTHLRVGDIGKQVGYADITYFYKQFRRHVSVTPTEWRNM